MNLEDRLQWLASKGCYPCVSYRGGGIWRAHVNACGNWWEDSDSPLTAMDIAVSAWSKAGWPMDGLAATAAGGGE